VEINTTITKIDKKIIVFIDDLDRLDGSEILEIFKLVRASSNFENTVFVVAFDKDYILSVLNSQLMNFRTNFLEKIFIAEFCLPAFENEIIYQELERRLKDSVEEKYHALIDNYFHVQSEYTEYILKKCIISIRDVIRFPNVFKVNFNQISNQVWFYDFLNLELIRYKFPPIYNFIRKNLKDIQESDTMFLFKINIEKVNKLWSTDENVKNYDLDIVMRLFSPHTYPSNDKNNILYGRIVNTLNENTSISIRCFSNCYTYFTLRLMDMALDDSEFKYFRKQDTIVFLEKIEDWSQLSEKTFEDLVMKMFAVSELESPIEFVNILKGLYYLVQKFQENRFSLIANLSERKMKLVITSINISIVFQKHPIFLRLI
jgi:predicted KAP-like P-loop ATPase